MCSGLCRAFLCIQIAGFSPPRERSAPAPGVPMASVAGQLREEKSTVCLPVCDLQRRRKGVFPQKPLLHHSSGSHGNSFHSEAAFGGLVSCTMLLSHDTAWRCAGALSRHAPSCKSRAWGCQCQGWDLPSPRAGQGRAGQRSRHSTGPGNYLTSSVVEKKAIQRRHKTGWRQKRSYSVMPLRSMYPR